MAAWFPGDQQCAHTHPADSFNGAEFFCTAANPPAARRHHGHLDRRARPTVLRHGRREHPRAESVAYWPLNENLDASAGTAGVYDAAGAHDGTYLALAQNAFNGVAGVNAASGFPLFNLNAGAPGSTGNTDQSWATTPALNLNTNTVTIGMWIYPDGSVDRSGAD